MQKHFDDGKGHYWIPLIDPIPPPAKGGGPHAGNDGNADALDSDSEGDEVCRLSES